MLMKKARKQIVKYGKRLQKEGLTNGTSGNLSVYDHETGYMAISPSGIAYDATTPEDIVIMTLDGTIIEGNRKPSSEHDLHAGVYRSRPDASAVVHMHSTFCTTLACMHEQLRAVHYAIADAGVSAIPSVPYYTFGTKELANAVSRTFSESPAKACILENHGIVACGRDLKNAFGLAQACEWTAEIQWRCMAAGTPHYLDETEMQKAIAAFSVYGQKKDGKSGGYIG